MIIESDRIAICIMAHAAEELVADQKIDGFDRHRAMKILYHAIRHVAYPGRAVYPKVRWARKGDPVVNRRQP